MIAAIGVGAFLGPLVLTRLIILLRQPVLIFGAYGLRGLVDVVLASVTALPVSLVTLAIYGLGTSSGSVTFSSLSSLVGWDRTCGAGSSVLLT